jgi:hypothetical protein
MPKISDLTDAATPLDGSETIYVVQGGNSRKATASQIAAPNYATRTAFIAATLPTEVTRAAFFVSGNTYAVVRDASGPIVQANGQTWQPDGDVTPQHFGAVGDGVADDAAAINAAASYVAAQGGGVVLFPVGTYAVGRFETNADSGTQHLSVKFRDKVYFRGAGVGATIIKSLNNADSHVFYGFNVTNCGVSHLSIDGNRTNQAVQNPSTGNDPAGIILINTAIGVKLTDLHIKDTPDYGIGFEGNMTATDCLVKNVIIENSGADAFDSKDAAAIASSTISNLTVKVMSPSVGQGGQQAAINVRDGWVVDGFIVSGLVGDSSGVRVNQGPRDGRRCSISNGRVIGGAKDTTIGLALDCREAAVSGVFCQNVNRAVLVRQRENSLSNIIAENVNTGISFAVDGSFPTTPSDNTVTNFHIRTATTGISIPSGCNDNAFIGGSIRDAATAVSDAGARSVIQHVTGYKTANRVLSNAFGIASVTTRTVAIPHGLPVTPEAKDCQITVVDASANDWAMGNLEITSTDATNVTVILTVTTASATGTASARLALAVRVKE